MTQLKRSDIELALVGRTIRSIEWNNEPIQATSTHTISRDDSDLAAVALIMDDGSRVTFSANASLDSDDVHLSLGNDSEGRP